MGGLAHLPRAYAPCRSTAGLWSTTTLRTFTPSSPSTQQVRHATFIPRPRRPYSFTQLVQLSDGSTYTMRTCSPLPIYRAMKDSRNSLLWQPSEKSLRNVELDEAGKLAAFRDRFGRSFDAAGADGEEGAAADILDANEDFANLLADYAPRDTGAMQGSTLKNKGAAAAQKKK